MGHLSKRWDDGADKKIIKTLRCHPLAVIIDKKLVTTTFLSGQDFETTIKKFLKIWGLSKWNSHNIPGVIELDCAVMAWESQFIFYQGLKLVHCWSHEPARTKQKSNIGLLGKAGTMNKNKVSRKFISYATFQDRRFHGNRMLGTRNGGAKSCRRIPTCYLITGLWMW